MNMFQDTCTQKSAFLLDVQMFKINLNLITWLFGSNFLGLFLRPFSYFTKEKITKQLSDFSACVYHI